MLMTSNQMKEAKANQDEYYGDAIKKKFYTDEKSLNDEEEPNATVDALEFFSIDESTNADKVKTEESF